MNDPTDHYSTLLVPGEVIIRMNLQVADLQEQYFSKKDLDSPIYQEVINAASRIGFEALNPLIDTRMLKGLSNSSTLHEFFVLEYAKRFSHEAAISLLNQVDGVISVEPVTYFPIEMIPDDEHFSSQEYLQQIFAPAAWDITSGDSSTITPTTSWRRTRSTRWR